MGLRIFIGREAGYEDTPGLRDEAILFCSTTGIAFGRVMHGASNGSLDAHDVAQKFLDWCEREKGIKDGDVRALATHEVIALQDEFTEQHKTLLA